MIITKVMLTDYGVYGGKNEFDLDPASDRPIILIGGANGAGKTTLFEAVPLCLYGISAADKRITRKAYEAFLSKKIHRYQKSSVTADRASVAVQFKFYHNSKEVEYRVERSWQKSAYGRTEEHLDVKKRADSRARFERLDTIETSHWQSFVSDLIPKGILRLFFFDGEKVVTMAKEGSEDAVIRDSFKSLLGIEVVEQLHADLQVNLTRNLAGDDKQLQKEITEREMERDGTARTVERLRERLAQKQTEMDALSNEIESAESDISKIGGAFASGRDDAKTRLGDARSGYEVARRRISDMCADALPLALIPKHLDELLKQMDSDSAIFRDRASAKMFDEKIRAMSGMLKAAYKDAALSASQKRIITSYIARFAKKEKIPITEGTLVFGFSESQAASIKGVVSKASNTLLPALRKETASLVKYDKEITTLESAIASAPADDEIGPLVSRVAELNSQRGALQEEMNHMEEKISSNRALLQHIDTKMRDLVSRAYKGKKTKEQIRLTHEVQEVLEEFIDRLRVKKIRLLEQYLLDATGILLHKKNLIHRIGIDPKSFEITIYDRDGKVKPKDMLSEGEKQMFATSVLWALAKTSGRPLPFMIDTPLARLDAEHRVSIVGRFLPAASHQTLVFSTDTEIEKPEYDAMSAHMTKSYLLAFDEDAGSTSPCNGYFWDRNTREDDRIAAV
ncbi:MAG: DNA sulfur modification protein DndD [Thaumarchaeota archaeon]|nr:DNA sulfur modification protein DndD [Nitrososphaerota archaeon]